VLYRLDWELLVGVKGVSNLLVVKPRVTPSELKRQIEQALVRTAELDAKRNSRTR
jgi:hypothetical protein